MLDYSRDGSSDRKQFRWYREIKQRCKMFLAAEVSSRDCYFAQSRYASNALSFLPAMINVLLSQTDDVICKHIRTRFSLTLDFVFNLSSFPLQFLIPRYQQEIAALLFSRLSSIFTRFTLAAIAGVRQFIFANLLPLQGCPFLPPLSRSSRYSGD